MVSIDLHTDCAKPNSRPAIDPLLALLMQHPQQIVSLHYRWAFFVRSLTCAMAATLCRGGRDLGIGLPIIVMVEVLFHEYLELVNSVLQLCSIVAALQQQTFIKDPPFNLYQVWYLLAGGIRLDEAIQLSSSWDPADFIFSLPSVCDHALDWRASDWHLGRNTQVESCLSCVFWYHQGTWSSCTHSTRIGKLKGGWECLASTYSWYSSCKFSTVLSQVHVQAHPYCLVRHPSSKPHTGTSATALTCMRCCLHFLHDLRNSDHRAYSKGYHRICDNNSQLSTAIYSIHL